VTSSPCTSACGRGRGVEIAAEDHLLRSCGRREDTLCARRRACGHTPAAEECLTLRDDIGRRIADIETVYFAPFDFAGDKAVGICTAKCKRFLRRAHKREIANAISKHQRAAGERAQHVDDNRNTARVRRTGEQAASFNFHRLQF